MQISGSVTQTRTMIRMAGNASAVDDFTLVNYHDGILMAGATSSLADLIVSASVSRGNMFQPVAGGVGITVNNFAGCSIDHVTMATGPATGAATGARRSISGGNAVIQLLISQRQR